MWIREPGLFERWNHTVREHIDILRKPISKEDKKAILSSARDHLVYNSIAPEVKRRLDKKKKKGKRILRRAKEVRDELGNHSAIHQAIKYVLMSHKDYVNVPGLHIDRISNALGEEDEQALEHIAKYYMHTTEKKLGIEPVRKELEETVYSLKDLRDKKEESALEKIISSDQKELSRLKGELKKHSGKKKDEIGNLIEEIEGSLEFTTGRLSIIKKANEKKEKELKTKRRLLEKKHEEMRAQLEESGELEKAKRESIKKARELMERIKAEKDSGKKEDLRRLLDLIYWQHQNIPTRFLLPYDLTEALIGHEAASYSEDRIKAAAGEIDHLKKEVKANPSLMHRLKSAENRLEMMKREEDRRRKLIDEKASVVHFLKLWSNHEGINDTSYRIKKIKNYLKTDLPKSRDSMAATMEEAEKTGQIDPHKIAFLAKYGFKTVDPLREEELANEQACKMVIQAAKSPDKLYRQAWLDALTHFNLQSWIHKDRQLPIAAAISARGAATDIEPDERKATILRMVGNLFRESDLKNNVKRNKVLNGLEVIFACNKWIR